MSWNYRIVEYRDGSGFGLHEVFYDDKGQPWSMTEQPASFACWRIVWSFVASSPATKPL